MSRTSWAALLGLAYVAACLAIGVWSARRTRTAGDFFIAGQRLGLWVTGLATMATAFSGVLFIGGPGLAYRIGVGSFWIVLPVGFTAGLLCWVVGRQLRALAGVREVFTVPDVIAARFGHRGATALAALAVAAGSTAYLAAQVVALGVIANSAFGIESRALAMLVGLAVILAYCTLGGMIAAAYTDVLQGTIMLFTALALCAVAVVAAGGVAAIPAAIRQAPRFGAEFLEPAGTGAPLTAFGFFFVFGVGVLGQPHLLHKFFMLADPRQLRLLPAVLGGSQALCLAVWIGLGLAVPALVAQGRLAPLTRPDDATAAFLASHAPGALVGLALAGVLAAIMSTASSLLNVGAAALVRDLPRALGRAPLDELRWGRGAVVGLGLGAFALATAHGDLVALLGTFAFGTFGAALAPAVAIGLNWSRVGGDAVAASIATGLVLNVGLELAARAGPGRLPFAAGALPSAIALAASLTVLVVGGLCSRHAAGRIPQDVRSALALD